MSLHRKFPVGGINQHSPKSNGVANTSSTTILVMFLLGLVAKAPLRNRYPTRTFHSRALPRLLLHQRNQLFARMDVEFAVDTFRVRLNSVFGDEQVFCNGSDRLSASEFY